MASGENKKVEGGGQPEAPDAIDVLLARAILPADAEEQAHEAFDLSSVRSNLTAQLKEPRAPRKRVRTSTRRVRPVRSGNWIWAAGVAALLAGSLTGWLLISPHDNSRPVVDSKKNDTQVIPPIPPPHPVENRKVPDEKEREKEIAVLPPTPPAPPVPKVENDSRTLSATKTPAVRPESVLSHGSATAVTADTKLFLGFNYNCAATGCQIENSVYARNGVAYVEARFAKNASVFGMKDGAIQYSIYNAAARTVTMLDPASRTYFILKNRDVAKDKIFELLGLLAKSENPDALLAYKQKSGVITTSVTKARTNAEFNDELLTVPASFTEVNPPK